MTAVHIGGLPQVVLGGPLEVTYWHVTTLHLKSYDTLCCRNNSAPPPCLSRTITSTVELRKFCLQESQVWTSGSLSFMCIKYHETLL